MRMQLPWETMERLEKAPPPPPPPPPPRGSATTGSSSNCILAGVALPLLLGLLASPPSKSTYHALFLTLADNSTAARHLLALTRRPHVAGTPANAEAASYVLDVLSSASFSARSASYDVLLSYPVTRSLLLSPSPPPFSVPPIAFDLIQEIYPGDPYATAAAESVPTFHAYSRSSSAAGPVVYANYGRLEDFAALGEMGVNVTGALVLARYGKIFRGDILKNAEDAGAAAAVVYTDAKDYRGRERWFPDGPGMPPSGVQVGTTFRGIGDPTTPGWPSAAGCERLSPAEVSASGLVPGIPSLPISARDGEAIQRSVGGQVAPDEWQGGEGAPVYRLGPGPGFLNLTYIGNETLATIQNVFAVIEGQEEPDRYVILGNHRDAWTFGAVDPSSGTAALLEVAERLGKLQKRGWRPRRTIVLCNWDAEEYGLIGSTEWVEENREMLASRAIAYLNADCPVRGSGFHASTTPQLDELLKEVTKKVKDPDNFSQTVYDSWTSPNHSPKIGRLGGGATDFAAFIQHAGVSSLDMYFGEGYPVYHSLYDDFVWMHNFGDPFFQRHIAVASIWGLIALRLADDEFLPFDYSSYASELQRSAEIAEDQAVNTPVSFTPLYRSIEKLKRAASTIDNQKKGLESKVGLLKWRKDPLTVRDVNDRLMMAERALTDREGLFQKAWYKHLIYGPSAQDDYGSTMFPGVDDAIWKAKRLNSSESWRFAQHEVWRVARAIAQASLVLGGKFT